MKSNAQKMWKLRYWIILGYAVPLMALVASAAISVNRVREVQNRSQELQTSWAINDDLGNIDSHLQSVSRTTRGYLLEKSSVSLESFNTAQNSYLDEVEHLESLLRNEQQIEHLNNLKAKANELLALNQNLINLVDAGEPEAAVEAWKQDGGRSTSEDIAALLDTMEVLEHEIMAEDEAQQDAALRQLQMTLVAAAVASVVLSALIGAWIVLKSSRLMNQSASVIASSANEIAASIEQQERTSSQQAASVSETTTTMDELGASSRQSAEQAEAAAAGAQQALKLAEEGTRAVERSREGMTTLREKVEAIADQILRLSEQTNQIGGISGLVSDLANQTNMLALNAAVEAVRAGEHGKGFAVVSGEIRKLADQSKKSAEKINALVADIQTAINSTVMVTDEGTKTVEEGVKISEETAAAFSGVADAVNNVVLNSQQISLNVKQQAVAIEQVVSAMNSLNKGAQETANGITQIKVGTHQLNESAMQLKVAI
jgi:methyl-accepting chemotaxis protein